MRRLARVEGGQESAGVDDRDSPNPSRTSSTRQKPLLPCTPIPAPSTLLYVKARSERGRRLFTVTEAALCGVIVVAALVAASRVWTGHLII